MLLDSEHLKLAIDAKLYGYPGIQLEDLLREQNMEPEFADPDYLVLMLSAETDTETLRFLEQAFSFIIL